MKLYGRHGSVRSFKILAAASLSKVGVEFINTEFEDVKKKEFLVKNPAGKIPVLETEKGFIFESNAILRHIARAYNPKLYGANNDEMALVDQWLDFATSQLDPPMKIILKPILGYTELNPMLKKTAMSELFASLRIVDTHLQMQTFMAANTLTIADLAIYAQIKLLWEIALEEKIRTPLKNLGRWIELVSQIPEIKATFGKLKPCQKEFPAGSFKKPEQKKPEPKKQEPAKKKAEPAKKKKEEEEDDIVIVGGDEKKKKNPLDLLPPSPFVLDDFKRLYVNAENKEEAFQYFLEHFDEQGYSLWKLAYQKAEGEGAVLFQTNNLMNGFLQRLESFRKYAFAVHGVYGEEPNLEIRGVWMWRGTEIAQEMKDAPSYEYHTVEKLDIKNNEKDLALLKEYWLNLDADKQIKVDGLTPQTVKYFK